MNSWFEDKFNKNENKKNNSILGFLLKSFIGNISMTAWLIIINIALFIIFKIIILANQDFMNYIFIKPSFLFTKYAI